MENGGLRRRNLFCANKRLMASSDFGDALTQHRKLYRRLIQLYTQAFMCHWRISSLLAERHTDAYRSAVGLSGR